METSTLNGKAWLITGGAGFFGARVAELVLARHRPRRIVIFNRDELKQHNLRARLGEDPRVSYVIGDVRDRDRLLQACREVDCVVHAAALKQVGASEDNPVEAVKTNVLGTANVIDAAITDGVAKALAISTDKAVDAVNLYGATKLCSEKLFVAANRLPGGRTRFSCIRCGNIAGSPASVISAFSQQKAQGRITIRDPRMTRFLFSLDQAAEFALSSLAQMEGGEIFIPRMPSLRIVDLAKAMAPKCPVEITGAGPGEKIHESLLSSHETRRTLEFPDRFVVYPDSPPAAAGGGKLPDEFSYSSDSNPQFLDRRSLLDLALAGKERGAPPPEFAVSALEAGPAGLDDPPLKP